MFAWYGPGLLCSGCFRDNQHSIIAISSQPRHVCLAETTATAAKQSERIVFKLKVELEKLEAQLQYESSSALPLASLSIEEVVVDVTVRPDTLNANASLGNLRAQDGSLPEVG